jgi:polysaccharide biosynthesis transport protein
MELKELITLYRRWFWLLILGLVLGLASGYFASRLQAPLYEASTRILITKGRQEGGADMLSLDQEELVLTYQQILKTRSILDEAESRLDLNIDPDEVMVDVVLNTQIIQVGVRNQNPQQAVDIANTLVQLLIEKNEALYAGRYTAYEGSLNSQIAEVQLQVDNLQGQINQIDKAVVEEQLALVSQQIAGLRDEIVVLENDIAEFPALLSVTERASLAEKQAELGQLQSMLYIYQQIQSNLTFIGQPVQGETPSGDPRRTSLQATLNLYQQLYLDLLNHLASARLARVQATPTVSQIDSAVLPERPVRPIPLLYTVLAGIVGLSVVVISVLVIDYFDDTLTSSEQVEQDLGVPVIGEIVDAPLTHRKEDLNPADACGVFDLHSFGMLRINISRLVARRSIATILVTSPALGDGKSTIAAHLARALAHAGKSTIVLEADLDHPGLHSQFGLDRQSGLGDILGQNFDWTEVTCDVDGVKVITAGSQPASGVSFESERMAQLLDRLQREAQLVILDGPPLDKVNSQILASKVGGVVLVVRPGHTLTMEVRKKLHQLELMDAKVLGIVLNRTLTASTSRFDRHLRKGSQETSQKKVETVERNQSSADAALQK